MGKALYRKYRPKKLAEVVGQEHITDTLDHALKNQAVSHAYLLTGPRGVGKTSIARILAHEVNNLPYGEDTTHMDIIEIDAASNRRIDEIRELKERINIAPTSAKYKVYIIDEVHMLTKEAFNALLKTLEEPPEHAIFILATTEAHKVPETIISRTQRFTFKPVDADQIVVHLRSIAKSENISIDSDALELIASHGEGSFRDSISLMDQVKDSRSKVSLADVQKAVGQAPEDLLNQIMTSIEDNNLQSINSSLSELRTHGVQSAQIAKQLTKKLRDGIVSDNLSLGKNDAISLLSELLNAPSATDPNIALEIALYRTAIGNSTATEPQAKDKNKTTTKNIPETTPKPETKIQKLPDDAKFQDIKPIDKAKKSDLDEHSWQEVLSAIKSKHNTLYGIARMATPKFAPDKLTLELNFAFHHKRLDDPANRQYIQDLIKITTGQNIPVECLLVKEVAVSKQSETEPDNEKEANLANISNIFGGAEIVE